MFLPRPPPLNPLLSPQKAKKKKKNQPAEEPKKIQNINTCFGGASIFSGKLLPEFKNQDDAAGASWPYWPRTPDV